MTGSLLPLVLLVCGWLNTLAQGVIAGARSGEAEGGFGLLGISPLALLIAGICAQALWRNRALVAPMAHGPSALLFAAAVLVPSSLVSAGALAIWGALVAWRSRGAARWAVAGFAGLGLCAIWQAAGARILAAPFLTGDAIAVEWLLGLVREGITRSGNVVGQTDGHRIIVFLGCATVWALPFAVLAVTVLLRHLGTTPRGFIRAVALVTAGYTGLNVLRLGILAWSPAAYAIGHRGIGVDIFDAAAALLVFAAAFLAPRGT